MIHGLGFAVIRSDRVLWEKTRADEVVLANSTVEQSNSRAQFIAVT